ncbi:uncharacterized protein BDV17DRAFT_288703 [Aspergillus undulatus]|uniref:uncharacterized protein n=1 Tax=Aspergillus undulatus TaxID=1810928 RepID=UPI003CCDB3C0
MRWTKEAEETLWQTIFKTQPFHLTRQDRQSMARKPTPKALKEHLQKYRKNLAGEISITFDMGSKKTGGD